MHSIQLPVVRLNQTGPQRAEESRKLLEAFHNYGFCLVSDVPGYRAEEAWALAHWFFYTLTTDQKMSLATKGFAKENRNVYRGYFPVQPGHLSCKEGFEAGEDVESATAGREDNPLLEPTPFPNFEGLEADCARFRSRLYSLRHVLAAAADTIMQMIAESGGEDKDYFYPMFHGGTPLSTYRIIRYPKRVDAIPAQARLADGRIIATGAHADSAYLTLLETFGQAGLELQLDGVWRPVPPSPNLLIVNIGEQLARMSRGRFKATIHRVIDIGKDRLSVPFFYEPHCDSNMNSTIPKSLLGDDDQQHEDQSYVPYATFLLKKLGIYAEYRSLQENIPAWMKEKYMQQQADLTCWAKETNQVIDGK